MEQRYDAVKEVLLRSSRFERALSEKLGIPEVPREGRFRFVGRGVVVLIALARRERTRLVA